MSLQAPEIPPHYFDSIFHFTHFLDPVSQQGRSRYISIWVQKFVHPYDKLKPHNNSVLVRGAELWNKPYIKQC